MDLQGSTEEVTAPTLPDLMDDEPDEVEQEWVAAVNARYGDDKKTSSASSSGHRQTKSSNQDQALESAVPPFLQRELVASDQDTQMVEHDTEEDVPLKSYVDSSNYNRVICEMRSGKKIAIGNLGWYTGTYTFCFLFI